MDKNAFSHVNDFSQRNITLSKFVVLGNFHVVRIARNESHQKHQGVDWRKVLQITFSILGCASHRL